MSSLHSSFESQSPTLRVQINQIDYSISQPGSLDNSSLPRVPVIRIYGPSSAGHKVCVHVHQVYPYFFLEYTGELNPSTVNQYIAKLAHSLNHAIAISLKRNPHSRTSQYVRAILLVKGIHFYGFHSSYSPFLKVSIADPALVTRATTILQSGTVMQTRFRLFESHLSYILQFLCDFGLYGCGWIDLGAQISLRGVGGNEDEDPELEHIDLSKFKPSPHFRQSRMALEVDVAAHQILNRRLLTARNIHHKLEIPAQKLPPEPLVLSVRKLWEDERLRRVARGLSPTPHIPPDPSEKSRGAGGDWAAEARWWDEIKKRIEAEAVDVKSESSDNSNWERWVMTTFESIEALWEDDFKVWKPASRNSTWEATEEDGFSETRNPYGSAAGSSATDANEIGPTEHQQDVDVDESALSSQDMNRLVEHEEAKWERTLKVNDPGGGDDDYYLEEEEAMDPEDGPLPDSLQTPTKGSGVQSPSDVFGRSTPSRSPQKRLNPFQEAFLKIARPLGRRMSISNDPITPTKTRNPTANTYSTMMSPTKSKPPSTLFYTPVATQPATQILTPTQPATQIVVPTQHETQIPGLMPTQLITQIPGFMPTQPITQIPGLMPTQPTTQSLIATQLATQVQGEGIKPDLLIGANHFSSHHDEVRYEDPDATPPSTNAFPDEREPQESEEFSVHFDDPVDVENASRNPSRPTKRLKTYHDNRSSLLSTLTQLKPSSSYEKDYTHIKTKVWQYGIPPPTRGELELSLGNLPHKVYQNPYYSRESDAPDKSREYAGMLYHLRGGQGLSVLEEWHSSPSKLPISRDHPSHILDLGADLICGWEYASSPPSPKEVRKWLLSAGGKACWRTKKRTFKSQIEGSTPLNTFGLKNTPHASDATRRSKEDLTVFSLEVFAPSRGGLLPDPDVDEIAAIFYSYQSGNFYSEDGRLLFEIGKIVVENAALNPSRLRDHEVTTVATELDLINAIADLVVHFDPDILAGWEVQLTSWGYLNARGRTYGFDVGDLISRAPPKNASNVSVDQWGVRKTSTFKVVGRHVLNLWRIMRAEQTLNVYTFENVAFQVLQRRMPRYTSATLTEWYESDIPAHVSRVLSYFSDRTSALLDMLDRAEIVTKTAEFARVFGIDFFSVISRGSQFKVESFMFRIAKPESFVLLSPSREDVGRQNAVECVPLIMEPLSAFYNSPLVVLDFQSLYPSVMIAYNYCYSTCLGRVTSFRGANKLGVGTIDLPPELLVKLQPHIRVAPNGLMFVKSDVRKGLLGRMLSELLDTRVMVKQAMKGVKSDKALMKILDARQLGLKFIANVTYGYTTATYSGRMPAVEIADSIVQTGRETLEKAIRLIEGTAKWGARVVYGDTDSVFIYLSGKTKDQAFQIGHDIADTVTSLNPAPIKLKFEKVYLPCVLMAKKRYVGFKYETPDEKSPTFDAKGIETVRRDGVPAQSKMVENCLKILFRTQDLSLVKAYCYRSWGKILDNEASIKDFVFAKEVRMGTYSEKVPPPPGVTVAARRMLEDARDEPQYGERIPYVIARGAPGLRLVDKAMDPLEFLNHKQKQLDGAYYISKVLIPPLERIFNLVGADVKTWFEQMPRSIRIDQADPTTFSPTKAVAINRLKIEEHFQSSRCILCGTIAMDGLCEPCQSDPQVSIANLLDRVHINEERLKNVQRVCETCTHSAPGEEIRCESLDCSWLFERKKAENKVANLNIIHQCISDILAKNQPIHN